MLKYRDTAALIRNLKKQIANVEHLIDKILIVADGQLITTYHQTASIRPPTVGPQGPPHDHGPWKTDWHTRAAPRSDKRGRSGRVTPEKMPRNQLLAGRTVTVHGYP